MTMSPGLRSRDCLPVTTPTLRSMPPCRSCRSILRSGTCRSMSPSLSLSHAHTRSLSRCCLKYELSVSKENTTSVSTFVSSHLWTIPRVIYLSPFKHLPLYIMSCVRRRYVFGPPIFKKISSLLFCLDSQNNRSHFGWVFHPLRLNE